MTAATILRIDAASVDYSTDDELRAFLAAWGATWGWSAWSCVCGVEREAPTVHDAWRAFRVHYVTQHVPAGVLSQQVARYVTNAGLEAAE